MKKYLLPKDGNFYKANLHCHTTISDGVYTPEEVKKLYMEKGYSIIAYTDHNLFITHNDLTDENFLALNGYESDANELYADEDAEVMKDTKSCHLCFVALDSDNDIHPAWIRDVHCWGGMAEYKDKVKFDESKPDYLREYTPECMNGLIKNGREHGFFVTYNHPKWSLEGYPEYMAYEGMNAMEIFNTGCRISGYDEYNPEVYDDFLRSGKRIYCIATDDNHIPEDMFGGFVMIKAEKLEYRTITKALEDGEFYASRGPEIYELWVEDDVAHIKCSDAKVVTMHTNRRRTRSVWSKDGKPVTEAEFKIEPNDMYIRFTVMDTAGDTADTNAYFTDELFD